MSANTVVIISYYDRRPISNLIGLLESLQSYDAGASFDVCIVVNRTGDKSLLLGKDYEHIKVLYRHNTGMNIGAWDHGWRTCTGYENVLFLQDDCYIARDGWLQAINTRLSSEEVGLVGEAANTGWDIPWEQLKAREANVNLAEHHIGNEPANRVDVYMDYLRRYNVPIGLTGYHMRSLIWAVKLATLRRIDGFPHGLNYGECIASEIAVTKKVQALGLLVENISNSDFSYIRHLEWNQDYPGGPFSKNPTVAQELAKLKNENAYLTELTRTKQSTVSNLIKKLTRQYEH